MGDPAGKMVDLLMTEESARIILIAFTVFGLCVALLFACILWLRKLCKSVKGESRAEFEKEQERNDYNEKVSSTQSDIEYLSELMVRLTETVNASNTQISADVKRLMDNMEKTGGGCAYGHELEKEINHIKRDVLSELSEKIDLLLDSDKESIKGFITNEYHYWMRLGYIDIYSLKVIDERFEKYKKEKGNTFVADMVSELHKLDRQCVTQNCTSARLLEERDRVEVLPSEHFHHLEADVVDEPNDTNK